MPQDRHYAEYAGAASEDAADGVPFYDAVGAPVAEVKMNTETEERDLDEQVNLPVKK